MEAAVVVGIDVSKRTLEVALSSGGGFSVANNEDGIGELLVRLRQSGAALVVLEASGGYESPAYLALWVAGCRPH
jgi:transposase